MIDIRPGADLTDISLLDKLKAPKIGGPFAGAGSSYRQKALIRDTRVKIVGSFKTRILGHTLLISDKGSATASRPLRGKAFS